MRETPATDLTRSLQIESPGFNIPTSTTDGSGDAQSCSGAGGAKSGSTTKRKQRPRSGVTRTACSRCRRSKVKCDGRHPICSRCLLQNEQCIYDVPEEGMTRMQHMTSELKTKQQKFTGMLHLLENLRSTSDAEAANLLARLRFGEPVESIISTLGPAPMEGPPEGGGGMRYAKMGFRSPSNLGQGMISPELHDSNISMPMTLQKSPHPPQMYQSNPSTNVPYHVHDEMEGQEATDVRAEASRLRGIYGGTP
ncbi:hypothetical protein LTR09_006442 [Extremus antarcticus]|uniref:Zn(2)-C6 fungal-type domain-containing protein n=1 Tax=Extremus antarcticus TaxID=702011 RepID=A0AAJ0DF07_9PEZI|nr:hypothetical protein LTR09_006442 [Extremus antarcticus]